jgi:hypothetical protein
MAKGDIHEFGSRRCGVKDEIDLVLAGSIVGHQHALAIAQRRCGPFGTLKTP